MEEKLNTIRVASCTLQELFDCRYKAIPGTEITGEITIPEYQRPYQWGWKQVSKIVADLDDYFKNQKEDKPLYYMGSLILHKEGDKLNVIDGQQRITTLAIMHKALGKDIPSIRYHTPISMNNIKSNLMFLKSDTIYEKIMNLKIDQINVTLIITNNEDDAYTFFETQNTGGVRLTGADIIKAHHLRDILNKGDRQNDYARIWEKQKSVDTVIEQVIKARWWNILEWRDVPPDRDLKGTKNSIIDEFSEKTLSKEKFGFQHVISKNDYSNFVLQLSNLSIRQPLSNGENFIDYLEEFCQLYYRLFNKNNDIQIPDEYYKFNEEIIKKVDGTAFLKEFYEIAMLCYVNRFGINNILEAAYWIFRNCYSTRVSNQKNVREDTIPSFIKNRHHIFDFILMSFDHDHVIRKLKEFSYNLNSENTDKNSVKSRFIDRVKAYFDLNFHEDLEKNYDSQLIIGIGRKVNGK